MANQNWVALTNYASQTVTGANFTGTSITDVSPLPDLTLTGGTLTSGTVLRINALGQFVVTGSATNLTLQIMYGGTGGTSLFTTGAVALSTSATNNWWIEAYIRVMTPGSSGTVNTWGRQQGVSTTANIGVPVLIGSTTTTINTLTSNALILAATTSLGLTSFYCYQFLVEQLN